MWALSLVGPRRVLNSDGRKQIGALLTDTGIPSENLDYFVDEVKYLQGSSYSPCTGGFCMTEPRLFDNGELLDEGASIQPAQGSGLGKVGRENQVRRSALWAAYGDALGWISELVDEKGLSRRTLGKPLRHPIGWKRRIGGRAGITVDLPVGCYSDDTQLRLATARSIRPDGFDVEAFSKVELPVWPSYALGGGRSHKCCRCKSCQTKSAVVCQYIQRMDQLRW